LRVTIICPNEHIEEVRGRSVLLVKSHLTLTTPLSPTGKLPTTHWICTCYLTLEGFNKLIELKNYSSIYLENPKKVLKELNLSIIK
jgi:hypothetical protein